MTDFHDLNEVEGLESLSTDLVEWEIGPFHGALPGAMKMKLRLDGEVIVSCDVERGFLHKGLEKAFERHPWGSVLPYADHLDPEAAAFGELALCLAVEEICGTEVPRRAQDVRIMLCELTRISAHLGYVVRLARAVQSDTTMHYVLRDRERILDLFELLTGARFSLNFIRFGGVASDVSEGFLERVLDVCDLIRVRIQEYNDLLSFNLGFLRRTTGVGVLSQELVAGSGLTGPNARASGLQFDTRVMHPYSGYERIDFKVPSGAGEFGVLGDSHDRFLLRLREIDQSIEIIKQIADRLPEGPFGADSVLTDEKVPSGEAYSRIESPRGLLGCHVVSDGSERPSRIQFRSASLASVDLISRLLIGLRIEDLPVILASLDINMAEVDK